jgi:Lon protease-like protein
LFLGEEDEDIDERLTTSLMDCVESSDQHKHVLIEISNEAREPYVFKSDNLCMVASFADDEDG